MRETASVALEQEEVRATAILRENWFATRQMRRRIRRKTGCVSEALPEVSAKKGSRAIRDDTDVHVGAQGGLPNAVKDGLDRHVHWWAKGSCGGMVPNLSKTVQVKTKAGDMMLTLRAETLPRPVSADSVKEIVPVAKLQGLITGITHALLVASDKTFR
jgi:hypothetical protein